MLSPQEEIEEAAILYATNREEFAKKFSNTVHEFYLYENFCNVNFSSLAESIPMKLLGWKPHRAKHNYDGYRGESYQLATEYCECKPEKTNINSKTKISGHANWNDLTLKKIDYLKKDNIVLMFSGWINGNLMYIATLPHNYDILINKITDQVNSAIVNHKPRSNGTVNYTTWIDCPKLRIEWLAKEQIWKNNIDKYSKKFYYLLRQKYNEQSNDNFCI